METIGQRLIVSPVFPPPWFCIGCNVQRAEPSTHWDDSHHSQPHPRHRAMLPQAPCSKIQLQGKAEQPHRAKGCLTAGAAASVKPFVGLGRSQKQAYNGSSATAFSTAWQLWPYNKTQSTRESTKQHREFSIPVCSIFSGQAHF